jgi:threonine aldolase
MAHSCDLDIKFLASHCDVFYIGGTKCGALCGEAVVFPKGAPKHFFTSIKQHGALMAKGRLIGLQFDALFTDNLYFEIARHAVTCAEQMKKMFIDKGYQLFMDSPTNQQFIIIPNNKIKELEQKIIFTHWGPYNKDSFICRFVTSWATTKEQMDFLEGIL